MKSGTPRGKLVLFGVLTSIIASYILVNFAHLPSAFGFGRFEVSVELSAANGLYPKAVVTYRGVDVGVVKELRLTDTGIVVELSIDHDVEIPADLTAEVHSTSAVGEEYVNLVPRSAGGEILEAGDVIALDRTTVPVSTAELLDNTRALVDSVPLNALATVSDELGKGLKNSSDDVELLLDSLIAVQKEATANVDPTISLINMLTPVLETQHASAPDIASYTSDLASFTQTLAASDADIRAALAAAPSSLNQVEGLVEDLTPTLPKVLTDLGLTGEVLKAYLPALEHVLIVLPMAMVAAQNVVPPSRLDDAYVEDNMDFELSFNEPPVCLEGYEAAQKYRDPNDLRPAPLPVDSYCKVPHDDPRIVRGARNLPCPNNPSLRSATAAGCGLVFQEPASLDTRVKPLPAGESRHRVQDQQTTFVAQLLTALQGGPNE